MNSVQCSYSSYNICPFSFRPHSFAFPAQAVLLGLLRFGTIGSSDDKAELHNISHATLEKYSGKLCDALIAHHGERGVDPLISLPTQAECVATELFYFQKFLYAGCIGSMDGKHFLISSDGGDPYSYKNYFNELSLTVLAYFDERRYIRWTSEIYPGKNGDGRLYNISSLKDTVSRGIFPPLNTPER